MIARRIGSWWIASAIMLALAGCIDSAVKNGDPSKDAGSGSSAGQMDASGAGRDGSTTADSGPRPNGDAQIPGEKSRPEVVSVPPPYTVAEGKYDYPPKSSEANAPDWKVKEGPEGMTAAEGKVSWTPSKEQGGSHHVVVEGKSGDKVATQEYDVTVAVAEKRAEAKVTAKDGGEATVNSPTSKIQGASVKAGPGAMQEEKTLSISELDKSPPMSNKSGELKSVEYGPSGQAFSRPALIALPLPSDVVLNASRVGAFVYNPAGRWERVRTVGVDLTRRFIYAQAEHFSLYAGAQSNLDMSVSVERMHASSACEGKLVGRAELSSPLSDMEASSINNTTPAIKALIEGGAADVEAVLKSPGFTGSLRFMRVFELVVGEGANASVIEQRVLGSTLYAPGDGSAVVRHTRASGELLAEFAFDNLVDEIATVSAHLRGAPSHALFSTVTSEPVAIAVRLHLVYAEQDVSLDPASVDDLGLASVDVAALTPSEPGGAINFDADCDRLANSYDQVDNRQLASLTVSPEDVVTVFAGSSIRLSASAANLSTPEQLSFNIISGAGTLSAADDENARVFSSSEVGRKQIEVSAPSNELSYVFVVDVLAVPSVNTPPSCVPSAGSLISKVGDSVGLRAVALDKESSDSALTVEWGIVNDTGAVPVLIENGQLEAFGTAARLNPATAGEYRVGCRAWDGSAFGPVGEVKLSVVAANENRLPIDTFLSPPSATILVGESLTLSAQGSDPDGDNLTFSWSSSAGNLGTPSSDASTSSVTLQSASEALITVTVSITDGKGPPTQLSTKVLVITNGTQLLAADADGDGFPEGKGAAFDCDDTKANVFPTAVDICGNDVDEDCVDGPRKNDCDDDGFNIAQGDCNDFDASIYPEAVELCNGIDDNCFGGADEPFSKELGRACSVGTGACLSSGSYVCAADGLSTVCSSQPGASSAETCNRIDDDCDGEVDEGISCGQPDAGVDGGVDAGGGGSQTLRGLWWECLDSACTSLDGKGFDFLAGGDLHFLDHEAGGIFDPVMQTYCLEATARYSIEGDVISFFVDEGSGPTTYTGTLAIVGDEASVTWIQGPNAQEPVMYLKSITARGGSACTTGGGPQCMPQESCGNGFDDDCDGCPDASEVECGGRGCAAACVCNTSGICNEGCACDPDCGATSCQPRGAEVCNGLDDDCNGILDDSNVCGDLRGAAGSIVGLWFQCADAACSSFRNSGLTFIGQPGPRPGFSPGYSMHTFGEVAYDGAAPYCIEGPFEWAATGSELTLRWFEGAQGPAQCAIDANCTQGLACRDGMCRTPCATDAECTNGTLCHMGGCALPSQALGTLAFQDLDHASVTFTQVSAGSGMKVGDIMNLERVAQNSSGQSCFSDNGGGESCGCNTSPSCDPNPDGMGYCGCDRDCGAQACSPYENCTQPTNDDCDAFVSDGEDPDCLPSCAEDPSQTVCSDPGETCQGAIDISAGLRSAPFTVGLRDDLDWLPGSAPSSDRLFWFDVPENLDQGSDVVLRIQTLQQQQSYPMQVSVIGVDRWTPSSQCPLQTSTGSFPVGTGRDSQLWLQTGRYLLVVEGAPNAAFELTFALRNSDGSCSLPDGDADGVTVCAGDCNDTNDFAFPSYMNAQGQNVPAPTETCDGDDNDCNGLVDDINQTCGVDGQFGPCAVGRLSCGGGCEQRVFPAAADYCGDEIDNDCDGDTDLADCMPVAVGDVCSLPTEISEGSYNHSLEGFNDLTDAFCGDGYSPPCACNDNIAGSCQGCACDPDCGGGPIRYQGGIERFYRFTLTETRVVRMRATAVEPAASGENKLGVSFFTQGCSSGQPAECGDYRELTLPAGGHTFAVFGHGGTTAYTLLLSSYSPELGPEASCMPGDLDADGQTLCTGDCNENNAFIYSGAQELCDGLDNNCDGLVDTQLMECFTDASSCGRGRTSCAGVEPGAPMVCLPLAGIEQTCTTGQDCCSGLCDPLTNLCAQQQAGFECGQYGPDLDKCRSDPRCMWNETSCVNVDQTCGCDMSAGFCNEGCACDPDCGGAVCSPTGPEQCTNAIDDDCDGFVDGTDLDCQGGQSCGCDNFVPGSCAIDPMTSQACVCDPDCGQGGGTGSCPPDQYPNAQQQCVYANSCNDLKVHNPQLPSGPYNIQTMTGPRNVYCEMEMNGGGFTLIARLQGSGPMPPWNFNLQPNNEFGAYAATEGVDANYYLNFSGIPFVDFMFRTIDRQRWLIADKNQVYGEYSGVARQVKSSSASPIPTSYIWFNRMVQAEDPWISLGNHPGEILYGEASFDGSPYVDTKNARGGIAVYIR